MAWLGLARYVKVWLNFGLHLSEIVEDIRRLAVEEALTSAPPSSDEKNLKKVENRKKLKKNKEWFCFPFCLVFHLLLFQNEKSSLTDRNATAEIIIIYTTAQTPLNSKDEITD